MKCISTGALHSEVPINWSSAYCIIALRLCKKSGEIGTYSPVTAQGLISLCFSLLLVVYEVPAQLSCGTGKKGTICGAGVCAEVQLVAIKAD